MDDELRTLIAGWGRAWGRPDLSSDVSVTFNPRLRKSLGRCRPSTGRISLATELRQGPADRLAEVLCHEVAHVAVYQLHGPTARPHGPEWRELVSGAGFVPHIRAPLPAAVGPSTHIPPARLPYEHRCPVCQSVRYARRPVSRWRCAECLAAGLEGELVITRHPHISPSP